MNDITSDNENLKFCLVGDFNIAGYDFFKRTEIFKWSRLSQFIENKGSSENLISMHGEK